MFCIQYESFPVVFAPLVQKGTMILTRNHISKQNLASCGHAHIEGYIVHGHELVQATFKTAKKAGCGGTSLPEEQSWELHHSVGLEQM